MPEFEESWHHLVMFDRLDKFVAGEIKRLMIFLPPRHTKSELVSRRLPAYILGRNPDAQIIAASYGSDLARRMNRDVQRIMDDDAYQRVFPNTKLFGKNIRSVAQGTWLRNSDIFEVCEYSGVYRGAGVGAGITGMGMTCLPGDSRIITSDGVIKIEDLVQLQIKPEVLSFNHERKRTEWKPIIATSVRPGKSIVEITLSSGRRMRCTADHPVFCLERGYRQARVLVPGETVVFVQAFQAMRDMRKEGVQQSAVQTVLSRGAADILPRTMRAVRQGIYTDSIRDRKGAQKRHNRTLLFERVQQCAPRRQESPSLQSVWGMDENQNEPVLQTVSSRTGKKEVGAARKNSVRILRGNISAKNESFSLLLETMSKFCAFNTDARQGQQPLQGWHQLCRLVPQDAPNYFREGRQSLCHLWGCQQEANNETNSKERKTTSAFPVDCPSHRSRSVKQQGGEFDFSLLELPQVTPQDYGCWQTDTISSIAEIGEIPNCVYDIQVEGNCNFFADEILVHNCGIIDDPLKNRKEANSQVVRDAIWDWYTSTFRTRLAPGGGILLTVTRWHEDDLPGRLLALAASDSGADQWEVVNLPAIAEEPLQSYDPRQVGDALWPDRFDLEELERTRVSLGSYDWNSLYQQRPAPLEGGLFKRAWFGDAVGAAPRKARRIRYWDKAGTASADAAYTVGVLMARDAQGVYYVEDVVRDRYSALDREQIIRQVAQMDNENRGPTEVHFEQEPGSGGKESAEATARNLAGFVVHAERVTGDKFTRAQPYAAQCEARNVKLVKGDWNPAYLEELTSFPNGKYKDQVDASSGGFNKLAAPTLIPTFAQATVKGWQ